MWTQSFTKMSAVVMQEIMAKMICEQCQIIATYVREDAVKKMKDELKKKEELFRKKKTAKYLEMYVVTIQCHQIFSFFCFFSYFYVEILYLIKSPV